MQPARPASQRGSLRHTRPPRVSLPSPLKRVHPAPEFPIQKQMRDLQDKRLPAPSRGNRAL